MVVFTRSEGSSVLRPAKVTTHQVVESKGGGGGSNVLEIQNIMDAAMQMFVVYRIIAQLLELWS